MLDIVLLILNYNNAKDTITLCNQLKNQKNINFKILVVDNYSPDNSYEVIKENLKNDSLIEVIKSDKNGGYAYGNNFGLKYIEKNIKTKYVTILNNDLIIDNETLFSDLINKYQLLGKDTGFISPMQKDEKGNIVSNSAWEAPSFKVDCLNSFWIYRKFFQSNTYSFNASNIEEVEILPGCFLFTSFEYFKKIGFFDEGTFLFLEERILYDKTKNINHKNYLIKDLFYYHESSSTIDKELSNIFKYKVLYDSLKYYTKNYRNNSKLKLALLTPLLGYSILELRLINTLKQIRKLIK